MNKTKHALWEKFKFLKLLFPEHDMWKDMRVRANVNSSVYSGGSYLLKASLFKKGTLTFVKK